MDFEYSGNPAAAETAAGAGQESAVGSQQDTSAVRENPTAPEGACEATGGERGAAAESTGGEKKPDTGIDSRKREQSHNDNAAARAARMKAERETEERIKKQYDDEIARLGFGDPESGQRFSTFEELREFTRRRNEKKLQERAQNEKRDIDELREEEEAKARLRLEKRTKAEDEAKTAAARRKSDFIRADLAAFCEEYPDVDVGKLDANKKFRRFAGSRYGVEPLAELYADYIEVTSDAERAALAKAESRTKRGTGSGGGSQAATLTAAQQKELDSWNANYPHLKMTAKEFLARG